MAHLITSSLGSAANSLRHIGTSDLAIKHKDRFILCTDGVYACMSEQASEKRSAISPIACPTSD